MANEEQLAILNQGVSTWNKWRAQEQTVKINLRAANLFKLDLRGINLSEADLFGAHLFESNLSQANLTAANCIGASFYQADLSGANLVGANLNRSTLDGARLGKAILSQANLRQAILTSTQFENAMLEEANLSFTKLNGAELTGAYFLHTNFDNADLRNANFSEARFGNTILTNLDLSDTHGLEEVKHFLPSPIGSESITYSLGKIPQRFLRGCGLSDLQIEEAMLYNPALSNEEINRILYKMYDLRATQAIQISPLFISYSHGDAKFVDKIETYLTSIGVRFWRDVHDAKAGRLERQIDHAMRLNPTVLLILSKHSVKSDWVEHEVRTARELEKEMEQDVLCPIALDDSWNNNPWPKRIMEQVMEYNILDFSEWEEDSKFEGIFRKLIDGLELFYKK